MELDDYDYFLPEELIAQEAAVPKDSSRLMVVKEQTIEHRKFFDIIDYLLPGDVLVINTTKVSRSNISGKKVTGSPVIVTLIKPIDETTFETRIKGRRLKIGQDFIFNGGIKGEIIGLYDDMFTFRFDRPITEEIKQAHFDLPIPPYVQHNLKDDSEYQTVYSKEEGSLAAPTAGLHFTDKLLEKIKKKGVKIAKVCLHIDYGTFLPIRGKLEDHHMHEEWYEIDDKNAEIINSRKGRLIPVGTTCVRTLESAADNNGKVIPQKSSTDIFIYPVYRWKNRFDALITNFHLPRSTLLLLVSAYFGKEKVLKAYAEAVRKKYRFYSLGDSCMLIRD